MGEPCYTSVFDGAWDAIYLVDREGVLTAVNDAVVQLTGYAKHELIGRELVAMLDPDEGPMVRAHFLAVRGGEPRQFECRFGTKNGATLHLHVSSSPLRDGDTIIGVMGIARDMTEQRRAAQEREQLRRQLSQAQKLEAIGQLVSGVAHELNNPLAAVIAYAQVALGSGTLDADNAEALDTIVLEARRAAKIVSSLLTFARQHQPERGVTDLNQIVRETVALHRFAVSEFEISLSMSLDDTLPPTWADQFQLQQVLMNLLSNAEQAMSNWPGPRALSLTTRFVDGTLTLTVADTGPGISEAVIDQVFNPFFTTKSIGEGTGLGLAISDGIVREHGGRIRVESGVGRGATFIIELPYMDPALAGGSTAPRRSSRAYITDRA